MSQIKLTEYSHGQGCGCKISPKILDRILASDSQQLIDQNLLVGNADRDDAAVYDLGNGEAIISTTDFFMPIVDDPFTFGRIAATNAISDVYAMGGRPMMAISIFGWPLDKLPSEVGREVVEGGRSVCQQAGMTLAGGHSIDSPEPIFGLAVTGRVATKNIKQNSNAKVGDKIYLTKPLGIGILSTAQKQKKISTEDQRLAIDTMCQLNDIGAEFAKIKGVNAMTDVTGFGLGGHLVEVCQGSGVSAQVDFEKLPILSNIPHYLNQNCSPGGAKRNFESYGHQLSKLNDYQQSIICDPQTSGGLLVMVQNSAEDAFQESAKKAALSLHAIGEIVKPQKNQSLINIQ